MKKEKKLTIFILAGLGLYLISTGITYGAFKYLNKNGDSDLVSPMAVGEGRSKINLDAPKNEACPLNGKMFTKAERGIWEKRRPLGVMIENHLDSRPQSGLSLADVVYEAVAEGGITRFLAIYFCDASADDVILGPVRSARTYYLDWISEYGDYPLYAHVGGANDFAGFGQTHVKAQALEQIGRFGWNLHNDLSAMSAGAPTFIRDLERLGRPVAAEHTMYSGTDKLWKLAEEKRNLTQTDKDGNRWDENFIPWKFKLEEKEEDRGEAGKIEFSFWRGHSDYDVQWDYNRTENAYYRVNGGNPHKDLNNDRQISAKVVIVQFTKETGPVDVNKHLLYQTIGKGEVIVFQDGQAISGSWQKEERTERTFFFDKKGEEIKLNPGQIWIEIVPTGNKINY